MPVHMRFVVYKMSLAQVFLSVLWFSPLSTIPPMPHPHLHLNTTSVGTSIQSNALSGIRVTMDREVLSLCSCQASEGY
jgi:hypothetical protein